MALKPMARFMDMMINQTKYLVAPLVSLRSVTAKAVLVHTMVVMVTVARLLRAMVSSTGSSVAKSEKRCPSFSVRTRKVVRISLTSIITWFTQVSNETPHRDLEPRESVRYPASYQDMIVPP